MDPRPTPDPFRDTYAAMASARAVVTATRLGVFDALADEAATPRGLAARLGLDPVGVEALLGALTAMGYLEADEQGVHRPSAATAERLVARAPGSLATFVGGYGLEAWDLLGGLDERLLGGGAGAPRRRRPSDPAWEPYVRGLFELMRAEHEHNAGLVPVFDPHTLLDVAGGHGAFSMAMCRRHPNLHATILDLPGSAAVGRRIVAEQGWSERIAVREGDALRTELGAGLDVISMFDFLHHLTKPQARTLLGRAHDALRDQGHLVLGETERSAPGAPAPYLGAVSGLMNYAQSGTHNYSRREIERWLREADFAQLEVHRSERSPWRLVYVARR